MLKKKALKKIFITTFTVIILLTIYIIPSKIKSGSTFKPNIEVEYVDKEYSNVYLLNKENQLVKMPVILDKKNDLSDKIKALISKLTISNDNTIPSHLSCTVPKNTKVLGIEASDGIVNINLSKEVLSIDNTLKEKLIESITYTILELDDINGISLYVDGTNIREVIGIDIPSILTSSFGINKKYELSKLTDVQKVVIYYIDEVNNDKYYVPITKYVNDNRDKIKIIVEQLSSSYIYEPNLISYLSKKVELINYEIDKDTMTLNFNNSIFMNNENILEEVVYSISYSVFDNYDVKKLVFQVDKKEVLEKIKSDINTK